MLADAAAKICIGRSKHAIRGGTGLLTAYPQLNEIGEEAALLQE